jgi:hypothetical protein
MSDLVRAKLHQRTGHNDYAGIEFMRRKHFK